MHFQANAVMIYFFKGKVIHSSLSSTRVFYYESVHPRLDLRGWDDVRFIYTGSEEMTRTDGWKCFVLQHMQAAVTTVSYPWTCISVASSVSIQLSITKCHVCFCTSDTWVLLALSALFLALILYLAWCLFCSFWKGAMHVLTAIMTSNLAVFPLSWKKQPFSSRYSTLRGVMNIGCEEVNLIRWNEQMQKNKTTVDPEFLKASHLISKIIDLENEMKQSRWCF